MNNKNHFKFSLSFNKQPLIERIFDADCYNQSVRYSIRIQDWNKQITSDLRDVFTKNNKELSFVLNEYELNKVLKNILEYKNNEQILELSKLERNHVNSGFSYKLSINNNTIIERDFSVQGFNINSVFSSNLLQVVNEWVFRIQNRIKAADEQQMWEDYDLIAEYNITSKEVRELSDIERRNKLYSIQKKHESIIKLIDAEVETKNVVENI